MSNTNQADIADAVGELLPGLADRAAEVDANGAVSAISITELVEAGVFRMMQPKWCGGAETEPGQFYDIVRAISGACGSTGWIASVLGVSPWHVALFDDRAQNEVWAAQADVLICSSYGPSGRLIPVDGGYELSGHWRASSGSAHASWALLGGTVVAEDTRPIDIVSALVPITDYRTVASWDAVGLRGAGSNDIHVDKKFVPNYRTLRNYDVALRRGPGQKINAGPLYRMPFGTMFNSAYTVPIIGVAESCLAAYLELMRDRSRLSLGGVNLPTDQAAQVAVARAGSEIDAADLQLSRNLRDMYERARRRHDISMDLRLRARRDQVLAAERAVTAIDLVFAAARGMALRRATPIERAWRNAHTGSAHAANDVASSLALCGRGLFGLPVDDMLV